MVRATQIRYPRSSIKSSVGGPLSLNYIALSVFLRRTQLTDGVRKTSLLTTATKGVAWSISASLGVMAISLAAQIVLGRLLTGRDFGIYAYAVAFYHLFRVCTDAGVGLWLARLDQAEYRRTAGDAFWLVAILSSALAVIVAFVALPISKLYDEPDVATLLWVLAASFPLSALRIVLLPGLQVHLLFQSLAVTKFVSAVVRYSLMVALAMAGFGPLSFVIPVFVVTIVEGVAYFLSLRLPVWKTPFRWRECRNIFRQSRWSLAGAFPEAISTQVDYAVLGLVVSTETVGIYFFAYQLTVQMVMFFSESLRRVILPVFARVTAGSEGEKMGLRLSASFLGVVAAPTMLLFTVLAEPLELLLWGGRWQAARLPMMLLAAAMPLHLVSVYAEMLTQSRGRFRMWSLTILVRGIFFGVAAYLAGTLAADGDVARVTLILAGFVGVGAVIEMLVLFRGLRLRGGEFLTMFLPPYLVAVLAALLVLWMRAGTTQPVWEITVRSVVFAAVVAVVSKIAFESQVRDVWSAIRRVRNPAG